jgi:tetratricopeptide (TPR) repeat protein
VNRPTLISFALLTCTLISLAQQSTSPTARSSAAQADAAAHFGKVHFPVSCNAAAQQQFDTAVAMLHSFFYPETIKAFNKVLDSDPNCAMAYWGIAISQRPNPLVPPFPPASLKAGLEAAQKGLATNPPTQRERDWLASIEVFFRDYESKVQPTRAKLYTNAMQQLYERYPQDTEAAVFYALALNESAPLADKTYANQLKAAGILEKVQAQLPEHPGVVHYLIHCYDYAPMAQRGFDAANKYAAIAPSAPHALHMPAHTYTMIGMWKESIKSNQAALAMAQQYAAKNYAGATDPIELHFWDFMEYDYLQLGQDRQAREVVDQVDAVTKMAFVRPAIDAARAAIPARYALERGAWAEAAALEVRPTTFLYAEAITRFAHAIGSSKTGNLVAARTELDKLQALQHTLASKPDTEYWSVQTEVLAKAASAWIARAEGHNEEAIKLMRVAADLEDGTEKHVAMENRLFPVREQLGYLLLEMNQPKQALAEFDLSLERTPNRLRGLYGAAKSAQLSGDTAKARLRYRELVDLTQNSEAERPEIAEAKKFMVVAQK